MYTSKTKKGLSLLLAIVMLFTMVPATIFTLGADESYAMMYSFNAASGNDFHKYYKQVYTVTFLDEIDYEAKSKALESWDISANAGSGEVVGWMYLNQEATDAAGEERYDVYVAGEGGVEAHPDTTHMFYVFSSLKEVNGMENFHTGKVKSFLYWFGNCDVLESVDLSKIDTSSATSFKQMFYGCYLIKEADLSSWDVSNVTSLENMFYRCYGLEYANLSGWDTRNVTNMYGVFEMTPPQNVYPEYSLKKVDLTGWNTSNVTTMARMFRDCENLEMLDLSSFDTSKVTTMLYMFYYCKNLKYVYIGRGWTTEAIKNMNDGVFNCCYALVGGKDNQEENIAIYNDKHPNAYYLPNVEYAKTKEEGGYLTDVSHKPEPEKKKYNVTYSFIGDVLPENVTAPEAAEYEEGTKVTVEADPSADGYVFSGWTTSDAEVAHGEFTINNDVHFVGSWKKLYKVSYEYDKNFDVPDGAPELPETVYYEAGDWVDVNGVFSIAEHIFVGWYTDDTDTAGNMFIMPEKDVTLYGYFKKPVESIEILDVGDIVLNTTDDSAKITVYVKPEDATIKDIVYESADESVAKVDKYGNITPVGEGTTTITVSSVDDPTKTDTITVIVKIPVTDIEVDKTEIELIRGEKDEDKINVTVTPEEATNKKVIYELDKEGVVTVDENGNIEAVGDGTVTITVKSEDNPSVTETVTVTVKTPVTEITVPKDEFELVIGDEETIDAKTNDDATNKSLIYESDNPGIVKVDNDGNIVAVGEGEATITITSVDNPDITETVTVKVSRKYNVTYIYVGEVPQGADELPATVEYKAGESVAVENVPAEVEGYRFVGWTTSDVEVSADNNFTMPSKDVVLKGYFAKRVSDVDIITNEITLTEKDEIKLTVIVTPEDAENKELIFESSDEDVVKVDKDGNITAEGEGEATITVTSKDDPNKKDTVKITVKKPVIEVDKVEADKEEITLKVGETDKIEVTVTPDNATDKEVTFESSDEDVVKVDKDGNIEAVGEGEAIITVKTNDGKSDTVKVTVEKEYKVTYEFIGEVIPDGVKAPGEEKFVSGSVVTVKPDSSAEGYIFSGWTTDDAVVKDGEFTINNDVHFVGSWSKLYKVTYIYDGDVPAGAPLLNSYASQHIAGENVTVKDNPEVKGYNFSGWSTTDASITDGNFTMPSKDVVIRGHFEKVIIAVEDIIVDRSEITLQNGEKDKITVTVTPDDATNKGVTYESSDEKIVKVDKNGNITAVGIGEATITVTSKSDPTKTETVKVTVKKVPVTSITAPEKITIILGQEADIVASVNANATNKGLIYSSNDEAIVKVDANGKLTSVGEGTTKVIVRSLDNPDIYAEIKVEVKIKTGNNTEHYMVFGKTEKIGWYSVSFDGGETFQVVFGNSNLVVEHGTVAIIKANDIMGDPFTFYINGKAVTPDENGYVTVKVDGYVLVGALGIPVIAPDVEESLNFIQRIIKAIKDFFAKIAALFKK